MKFKPLHAYILAFAAGLVLFVPFLGGVHLFDWDEINFAESAREMIKSGDYLTVQINYLPFREKPPLFFWLQVLSAKLFGINEFAMRFPNAVAGIFTLIALFRVGRQVADEKFGLYWMLVYTGSILPFFYFKSGIIDPWFNLFTFLSVTHFSYYFTYTNNRTRNIILSGVFLGLAILTKGPVALLILILVFLVYLSMVRFRVSISLKDVGFFILSVALVGGSWFLLQILDGNVHAIRDFIVYQIRLFSTEDAGHGGFFLYHFVIVFIGVFPASVFALPAVTRSIHELYRSKSYGLWMRILFWTVMILFSIVETKIVHYSSLSYFPLTFLATHVIYRIIKEKLNFRRYFRLLIVILSSAFSLILILITLAGKYLPHMEIKEKIQDDFVRGNLEAHVHWSGFEMLIALIFICAILYLMFTEMAVHRRIISLFLITMGFSFSTIVFITPKIEAYSQRAAIEFFESVQDEDAYIATLGYKSYAHLFYGKADKDRNPDAMDTDWLLQGDIDKPVYFVFKINKKEKYLTEYGQLKLLYIKNGFVFTKREIENDR